MHIYLSTEFNQTMHAHSKICLSVKDDTITRIDSMDKKTSPVTTANNRYEPNKRKIYIPK